MSNIKTYDLIELEPKDGDMQCILQDSLNIASHVVLLSGVYKTGPLEIPSDTTFEIRESATLRFIPDFDIYPPVFSRWEGEKCWCMHPCLWVDNAKNVSIKGPGTIDGSGEPWWQERNKKRARGEAEPKLDIEKRLAMMNPDYRNQPSGGGGRQNQFLRPPLLQIKNSNNVLVDGITITDSPFWTLHTIFSKNISIRNVYIKNPQYAPNTDGIDIESSSDVIVENTTVDVGDDGIALKSGSGPDGIKDDIPTENVIIRGCVVKSAHGGAVIGSETAGGINNIHVDDCLFDGTDRGIRIKTRRGRGGVIHDLFFKNLTMKDNLCPFVINTYYRCGTDKKELFSLEKMQVTEETPRLFNVFLENCNATGSKSSAGMIVGLPESPVENVEIKNCSFKVSKSANRSIDESDMYLGLPTPTSRGFRIRYATDVSLDNLYVETNGEKILIEDGVSVK